MSADDETAEALLNTMIMGLPEYGPDEDTPVESDEEDEFSEAEYDATYSRLDIEDPDEDVPLSKLIVKKDALEAAARDTDADDEDDDEDDQPLSTLTTQNEKRRWKKKEAVTDQPSFNEEADSCRQDEFAHCSCPTDFFLKFFDEDIRKKILFETNQYAVQKGRTFTPVTDEELLGFTGINFFMGYHQLPSWRDYWCLAQDLHVAIVAETMPRNRFADILSNLHCNNNLAMPTGNTDRLYKLRPLMDGFNERFAYLYHMGRRQSVDESMILFKGRSTLKQYNPMKPIKRGYKLWTRADNSGYIGHIQVYQGKGTDGAEGETFPEAYGLGEKVVHSLTRPLVGKHYEVYFDNFFSSVPLMENLKEDGILACGTIRSNRKHLPALAPEKDLKERGQYDHRVSDKDITTFKWKDNKAIMVISNFHGTEETSVQRRQRNGEKLDVPSPTAIADYNKNMGGVDKADMLRALYAVNRKSLKWWHRIYWGLLDIGFVNSYVAYQSVHGKMPLLQYRRKVTMGLLTLGKPKASGKKRGRPSSPGAAQPPPSKSLKRRKVGYSVGDDVRLQNVGCHMPEFVPQRGRCEVCSVKGVESRPHSKCTTCKIFLCMNEKKNCFTSYHSA